MLDTTPFTSVQSNLEYRLAILTESFSPLRSVLHNLSCWSPKQKWGGKAWGGKSHFNVISLFRVLPQESQNPRDIRPWPLQRVTYTWKAFKKLENWLHHTRRILTILLILAIVRIISVLTSIKSVLVRIRSILVRILVIWSQNRSFKLVCGQ